MQSNVEYAAAHHFGVDKTVRQQVREYVRTITKAFGKKLKEPMQVTVKKHERDAHLNLPARPFMTGARDLNQDETGRFEAVPAAGSADGVADGAAELAFSMKGHHG